MTLGSGPIGSRPIGASSEYDIDVVVTLDTGQTLIWEVKSEARTGHIDAEGWEQFLRSAPAASAPPPPPGAERLGCYLLPKRRREAILGDLEEDYWTTFLPKFGPREARRMYWSHFLRSVAATVPAWIWGAVIGALGWLWSKVGS